MAIDIVGKADALIKDAFEKTMRGTALSLFGAIMEATPRLTGRLVGNWDITVGHESDFLNEDLKGSSAEAAAIARSQAALVSYKEGDDIYITNNVKYAIYVEEGTDKMRGQHMVLRTKDSFNSKLEENAAKFRIS